MQRGFAEYMENLDAAAYPFDFLYFTTTAPPEMWDNSPPNLPVAKLIRQWNEDGRQPAIRYVTSEDLLARINTIPADQLPLLSGDWTDYWNFGCGSTAATVARSRAAKRLLAAADRFTNPSRPAACRHTAERAGDLLDLYDEHTWTYWDTDGCPEPTRVQDTLKAALAIEAHELATYTLTSELETMAGNPAHSETAPDAVLFVNPAPVERCEYVDIPKAWRNSRKPSLRCERFKPAATVETETVGPIELLACGCKQIPLAALATAANDERLHHDDQRNAVTVRAFNNLRTESECKGQALLESPTHRLAYDPATGRVLGLLDKSVNRQVLAAKSPFDLFDFVRERPDTLVDGRREAIYERDLEKEKHDLSCWKHWRAVRERATRPLGCRVEREPGRITLARQYEAPGVNRLQQRITLRADSPVIELEVEFEKTADTDPEAIYFTIPLSMPAGWRCHFDTAGIPVELDKEQLPGACRGWLTVESYVAMHTEDWGATLLCPDAPLVMPGDFNFGPPLDSVPRNADPLLLAWPLNNYWNTNFPRSQAGAIRLRYGLWTHTAFNPGHAARQAAAFANPILAHPAFNLNGAVISDQ